MPRKARIDYAGLTHHIMARTFNDLLLFADDKDRTYYLSCLSQRIRETSFVCYAWVLMDTHVHLLIRTSELPLWKLMKPLNGDYARYYNKKYDRRGPLFCDRYKSIATQDQNYLEQLIRYIHLNPVRAGICKTVNQLNSYRWSGHRSLVKNENNGFQEIRQVLRRFGKAPAPAAEAYLQYIQSGLEHNDEDVISMVRASNEGTYGKDKPERWAIGDAAFMQTVFKADALNRLAIARYKRERVSLEDLLRMTAEKAGVKEELILMRTKRTLHAKARMLFCFLAGTFGFPTLETGRFLGIGQAAVSNSARKGMMVAREMKIDMV